MTRVSGFERRIRWCSAMIALGIGVLLLTLLWEHPLSFMLFLILGCPLVLVGVLIYLYMLAARS